MSELIDERVVEMRFDNAQFEQNVNQSIKTINKLKDSLDFENAGESFENISAAAAKCDMKPLEESLDGITVKFNMLEMVAANVLGRIINQVIDAGAKMAKSLTIDQVNAGWSKYAQKTEAVQTIMSATGASIDYVNSRLEKLIWFADETSYDFVDMVNNIGKFTSAGVDLDDAVDSMMGISNWAAASGAGIQQASRAMYNLSQAMGMGYVGLTDWRSIELANMATEEFKETVIATALDLGTLKQEANGVIKTLDGKDIVSAENMRASLKKGWFTGDVLTTALKEYNEFSNIVYARQKQWAEENDGEYITVSRTLKVLEAEGVAMDTLGARAFQRAQEATTFNQAIAATADAVSTQWMKTFELIFGNYEQAKKLWTELSNDLWDIFAGPSESRNESLKSILDSNYKKMLEEMPDPEEMNARLSDKLYEMTKNNRGETIADYIFSQYDSLEQLLQNENYTGATLRTAFKSIADDYTKEADNAAKLSKTLKSGQLTLKQAAVRLSGGIYGKEIEQQRKVVEEMGFNYEELLEYAQMWEAGVQVDWDAAQKGMIKNLDAMEQYYRGFAEKVKKISPLDEFLQSLSEISGREKLIGGFQNIFKSVKNIYLTITAIADGISSLFGSDSFLGGLIDGFYNLTSIFALTDDKFESLSENIYDFFNGGIQKLWHDFWYGSDDASAGKHFDALTGDYERVSKHIPGVLEKINNAYEMYIGRLPEHIQNSLNTIKNKITGFFGGVPKEVKDLFEKVFGHFEKAQILTNNGSINTLIHVGGIFEDLKTKVSNFMSSTGGTVFNGLINGLKKIADYLFGYETETGVVEGKIIGIYDKVNEFINKIKTIGKSFHEFLFGGKDAEGKDISNIFGRIGTAIESITNSAAFRTIKEFFLGKDISVGAVWDEKANKYLPAYKHVAGLIDNIKASYDSFVTSEGFQSVKKFIFGGKDAEGKDIPNIFGRIGKAVESITNSTAFKAISEFIFGGKDAEGKDIPNIFGRIGTAIESITNSTAFKAISEFIFGGKDAEGKDVPNIFGRMGAAIESIVGSEAFESIKHFMLGDYFSDGMPLLHSFLFGTEEELSFLEYQLERIKDTDWFQNIRNFLFGKKDKNNSGEKNSFFHYFHTKEDLEQLNIFEKIKAVLGDLKRYLFGWKDTVTGSSKEIPGKLTPIIEIFKEIGSAVLNAINSFRKWLGLDWEMTDNGLVRIPGMLDKIGKAAEWLKQKFSELPAVVLDFFLGPVNEEGKRTENIFKRIPGYIEKAKNGLLDFFLGKKVHKGTTWSNELNSYIPLYEREGNLIDRLKEKFASFRETHAWFDTFCNFIETQIQNISKIFSDANGNITTALNNLNAYLFGGDIVKNSKNELGEVVKELTPVSGVVSDIRESIDKLLHGGKEKGNFLDTISEKLGFAKPSAIQTIGKIVLGLMGLSVIFTKVDLGKFGEFGFSSALENFTETIKDFAISLAILAGTLIGITFFIKILKKDYLALAEAGLIIVLIAKLLANIFTKIKLIEIESNGFKRKETMNFGQALMIKFIVDAVSQLALVIAAFALLLKIGNFSNREILTAVGIVAGLLYLIGVTGKMMTTVAKEGQSVKTAAPAFFAFSAILFGLSNFVSTLALVFTGLHFLTKGKTVDDFTTELELIKLGLLAIASMIGVIAVAVTIIGTTGKNINGSTVLLVVSLMAGLTAIVLSLNYIYSATKDSDWHQLAVLFGGIAVILLAIGGSIALIGNIKRINKTAIKTIQMLPVFIAALGVVAFALAYLASVAPLSNLDNLKTFFISMAATVLMILPLLGIFAIINSANKVIKDSNLYAFGELLVGLLEVITVVATVFWMISKISVPDISSVGVFLAAMGGILLLMIPTIYIFKKIGKELSGFKGDYFVTFLGLYGALVAVSLFANLLMGLTAVVPAGSWDKVGKFLLILAGAIGVLYVLTDIFRTIHKSGLDKINDNEIKTTTKILHRMALALLEISGAAVVIMFAAAGLSLIQIDTGIVVPLLELLGTMYALVRMLPYIVDIFGELDVYASSPELNIKKSLQLFGVMILDLGMVAGMAAVLSAVVKGLTALNLLDDAGSLFIFLGAMYSVILVMSSLPDLMSRIEEVGRNLSSNKSVKNIFDGFIATLILFSSLMLITILLLTNIPDVPVNNIGSLLLFYTAMASTALVLVGVERLMDYMISVGKSITNSKISDLVKVFGSVLLLTVVLGGLVISINAAAKNVGNLNSFYSFILAMASIGVMLAVLNRLILSLAKMSTLMLSANGLKGTLKFIGSMLAVGVALGGLVFVLSKIADSCSNISNILPFIAAVGATGVLILALSGIVALINRISKWGKVYGNVKNILKLFGGISIILIGLTAVTYGLSLVVDKVGNLKSIGSFLVTILEVAGAILALSLIVTAIGYVSKIGKGVVLDAGIFMAEIIGVITIIGLIIAALGWLLKQLEKIEDVGDGGIVGAINKFGDMFESLGNALGRGVGGLIGGIGEGLTDSLFIIGNNLSAFMVSISPFLSMLGTLNETHKTGIGILTAVMAGILEATFYEKITQVLSYIGGNGDLTTIVSNLSNLTTGSLIPFLTAIKDITADSLTDLETFNSIMVKILEATFYSSIANILAHLGGEGDLPVVIQNLKLMVTDNLRPFLDEIAKIKDGDKDSLDTFNDLMLHIIEAEFLSKVADIIAHIGGNGDLPAVIENLKLMVTNNLRPFLDEISKIKDNDFTAISQFNSLMFNVVTATFLGKLADIINHLGGEGDLPGVITNLKDMYVNSLRPFITSISDITDADTEHIKSFNGLMLEVVGASFLDKVANVINAIGPDNKTTAIITSLKDAYNNGLRPFLTDVSAITESDIKSIRNFNSIMGRVVGATFFAKLSEVISKIGEDGDMTKVLTKMKDMVVDLEPFLNEIRKIGDDDVTNAANFTSIMESVFLATFFDKIGGVIESIGGEDKNLDGVFTKLETAAKEMKGFLSETKDISDKDKTGAQNFASIMSSVLAATFFDKIGGVIESIGGEDKNLDGVFTKLETAAKEMKGFLSETKDISEDEKKGASRFAVVMSSVLGASFFGKITQVIQDIGTGEDLTSIATTMGTLSGEMSTFLQNVIGIKQEHVDGANFLVSILKTFIESQALAALGKVISFFAGDNGISELFTELNKEGGIVDGVISFSDKVNGKNFTDAASAAQVMKLLIEILSTKTKSIGDFVSFISNKNSSSTITDGINYLSTEIIPKLGSLQTALSDYKIDPNLVSSGMSVISKVFDILGTQGSSISGLGNFLITRKMIGSYEKNQDAYDNIARSFKFITDEIIPKLKTLQESIKGNDFSDVGNFSDILQSVFSVLSYDSYLGMIANSASDEDIKNSFDLITNTIIPSMQKIQTALLDNEIDPSLIEQTIGSYAELISGFAALKSEDGEFSQVGQFVVEGLINALTDPANVSAVRTAAYNLGLELLAGLREGTDEHSPSKAAFQVGQFITEGLTNGLRAGEPLTWDMARQFGEGTIEALMEGAKKYDSYGLTQHAINMVTSDLVDENIFNMPDFTEIDRFGNEVQNFEKMEDYLKEKFGGTFDNSYIEGFIGSMKKAASEVPQVINDADYANMMVNIAEGDFGFGQDAIIDSLTKELGDVNAATQAWQDYTDVLAGNIEINKDLLKQRKQNPPMTEEQWMAMYAWDKEGFDRANRGEFLDLAAANGTTWQEEAAKRGFDPKRIQAGFNAKWWNSESYYELYIKNLAELELAQESAKNIGEQSALSVVGAAQEVTEAVESTTEAIAENAETVKDIPHNYQDASAELEKQAEMHREVAKAAEESAEAAVAAGEETTDAFDYNAWEKAVKKASSGVYNLTEAEQKLLMLGREETITKGTFGIGVGTSGWANNMKKLAKGLSDEEAKWAADFANWYGNSDQTLEEYIKAHNTLYSAADSVTSASGDASNAMVENFSDAYDQLDDKSQNFFTKLSERLVEGVKNGTKNLDITDLLKDIGYTDNTKQLIKLDDIFGSNSGLSLEDKINYLSDPKRLAGSVLSNIGSVDDFTGNLTEVIKSKDILKEVVDIFTDPKGVKAGFLNKVGDVILETFGLANKEADELSEKEIAPKVDNSGLASFNAYLDEIYKKYELITDKNGKPTIAQAGSVNLQNGEKVTSKQAAELQKVWDMAMMGAYGNSFKDISDKLAEMGIDYASLFQLSSGGKIDWSQYTDDVTSYAKTVKELGSDYTVNDLINDSNAGKFGETMAERKKAYELAGLDAEKAEALFQEYLKKGPEALENIGDDYAKLSDAELEAKKKAEEYNEVLNTTPQGAFRAISDFLEGVTKVIDDDKSADKFRSFIDGITGPLQDFNVDKASEFEKIAGFLNAVRTSARESTAIAKDFAAFVDGIDSSIEKLGQINIENPEAMDRVKEFLNGIKIENKETLDTVAAFIQSIVSFAEGSASSGDYATQLSATITAMVNEINALPDIDTKKTEPLTNFIDKLTAGLGLLQKDDSNTVRTFLTNFYAAFESSENQAQTAAGTIASAVISKLRFYYNTLKAIGRRFTEEFAKGIESNQSRATQAGQTIAGAVMASLREGSVQKASDTGTEFVSNLVTSLESEESKQRIKDALGNLFEQTPEEKSEKETPHNYKDGSLIEPEEKETESTENTETSELTTGGAQQGLKYGQEFLSGLSSAIQNGSGTISGSLTSMFAGVTAGADAFSSIAETAQTSLNSLAATLTDVLANEEEGGLVSAVDNLKGLLNGIFPDGKGKADAMINGMIEGLAEGSKYVSHAMRLLSKGIVFTVDQVMQINSPSKVMHQRGLYIMEGWAEGLHAGSRDVYREMNNTAEGSLSTLSSAIKTALDTAEDSISTDPVIRPVVDLSEVYSAASAIDNELSTDKALDISTAEKSKFAQNGSDPQQAAGTQIFNQYNYSPKPLSRADIYRQTRNQFAMLKGVNQAAV